MGETQYKRVLADDSFPEITLNPQSINQSRTKSKAGSGSHRVKTWKASGDPQQKANGSNCFSTQ